MRRPPKTGTNDALNRVHVRPVSLLNRPAFWVLDAFVVAALAIGPAAYGATTAWGSLLLLAIVAGAVTTVAALIYRGGLAPVWSWSYVPIIVFVAGGFLQMIPIPTGFLRHISPASLTLKESLLSQLGVQSPPSTTLSFYALGTASQLRIVLCAVAIFFTVLHAYRAPRRIEGLLTAIAAIGLGVALMVGWQAAVGATTIYGVVPVGHKSSGPFLNHSHLSQFMNLSVGSALAVVLMHLGPYVHTRGASLGDWHASMTRGATLRLYVCGLTLVFGPLAVFLSLSRGGMVSLAVSLAVVGGLMLWRFGARGKFTIVMTLVLLISLTVIIFAADPVYERLAALRHVDRESGGRGQIVLDILQMWKQFPIAGIGLGAFSYVYPLFDHTNSVQLATHAENEYAQILAETGIIGLLTVAAFLTCVVAALCRALQSRQDSVQIAVYGLAVGFIAVLVHSAADFGQHVPAIAMLSAVTVALLMNLATAGEDSAGDEWYGSILRRRWRLAPAVIVLAALIWSINGQINSARAERVWGDVLATEKFFRDSGWQGSDTQYVNLLVQAMKACELEPGSVDYCFWLNWYRWKTISRHVDPRNGSILLDEQDLLDTRRLINEFGGVSTLCPTYGPAYWMVGQLRYRSLQDPDGASLISQAYRMTAYDPLIAFDAAGVDLDQHRPDQALEALRRAVLLDPRLADPAMTLYFDRTGRVERAHDLARHSDEALFKLAAVLRSRGTDLDVANQCEAQAVQLLEAKVSGDDASADAIARLAEIDVHAGRVERGIDLYRRALNIAYTRVDWRMQLARLLADRGQSAEANREARVCLRLAPGLSEAQRLIDSTDAATK